MKCDVTRVFGDVTYIGNLSVRCHPSYHALFAHSKTTTLLTQRPPNFAGSGARYNIFTCLVKQENADVIVTIVFLNQCADVVQQRLQIEHGGDVLRHIYSGLQSALDAFGRTQRLLQFSALLTILNAQTLDTHVSTPVDHMDQQRHREGRDQRKGEMRPGWIWTNQQGYTNPAEDRDRHHQRPPGS